MERDDRYLNKIPNVTAPFHPNTLSIVTERIAANDNFHCACGALHLLGSTLRQLRRADKSGDIRLLHLHHIAPDYPPILHRLATRINKTDYLPLIKANSTDADTTANRIDETLILVPPGASPALSCWRLPGPIGRAQELTEPHLTRTVLNPVRHRPVHQGSVLLR